MAFAIGEWGRRQARLQGDSAEVLIENRAEFDGLLRSGKLPGSDSDLLPVASFFGLETLFQS